MSLSTYDSSTATNLQFFYFLMAAHRLQLQLGDIRANIMQNSDVHEVT